MRGGKRLGIKTTVAALGLVLVVGILVSKACSCLPTVYQEVELAAVPDRVLVSVANIIDVKFADSDQLIRGIGGNHHHLA